jgi:hypothetical protein
VIGLLDRMTLISAQSPPFIQADSIDRLLFLPLENPPGFTNYKIRPVLIIKSMNFRILIYFKKKNIKNEMKF